MSARILGILTLISMPVLVCGQQSQIAGPVTGYVFDRAARSVRPILGIPGASLLGDPVDFGLQVTSVSVAPRQDSAFVTAGDGALHLFRIQSGATTDLNLNGLLNAPQSVVFSPSGTAAALYAGSSVQVVTGLPDSAAIAASLTLQTPFDSLALSDDGAVLLAASSDGVELFNGAADQGALTATTGSALLAFAPSSHDAAVVDRRGAGLVLFRNITAPVAPQPLAATDDAIQSASALAFSADGQQVLLATGQSVATFDLAAGARGSIPCACSPARLARIGDLFRLNELGTDPLWLLDARPATAGVLFVPAMASSDAPSVSRLPTHPGDPIRGGRRIEPLRTSQALPE